MHRPILALSLVVTSACSFQMRAGAAANGTAPAAAPAPAPEPPRHSGKGHGKTWSASFHKSGSVSAKFDWQGRSGQLCRASAPFKFVGMAKASGSAQLNPNGTVTANGTAQASGKTSGGSVATGECAAPRTHVPATPKPVPVTHPEKPEPPKADKSPKPLKPEIGKSAKPDPKALPESKPRPSAKPEPTPTPTPTPAPGPTPAELEKPVDPPADPPPNVFGYDKPVLGCFEGQVFPLANDAPKLPTDYASLTPVSVVYACEWDIAPRAWDQGFPGIADRFEWFAIRYSGAFRIATAGEYAFRISSDDGSKVIIDGKQVIDNDGQHPPKEASGKVQLSAGDHQMVLEYFQGPRFHINLQLWVTPPGKPEELFTVR